MPIYFQSATNAGVTTTNSTSLAVNKPTSTVAGDLLVTAVSYILGQTLTTLAGWTLVDTQAGSSGVELKLFYRVCDGSEGSTFTWSYTTTAGSSLVAIACARFTGAFCDTPGVLGATGKSGGGSITTKTPATISTCAVQSLGIVACGVRPDLSGDPVLTMSNGSGWVSNANAKGISVTSSNFDAAVGISYNLSGSANVAPPDCSTTAACEYGTITAEFEAGTNYGQVWNQAAMMRAQRW